MRLNKHAAHYINKLSNKLRRKIDAFPSRAMLSGSQGRVLHFVLAQNHDVFQKDIEEEFGLRPPTATQLLKKRILVSEKALQYKDVVITDLINLEEELTKEIPQEEMDIFFRIIEKMMENVS